MLRSLSPIFLAEPLASQQPDNGTYGARHNDGHFLGSGPKSLAATGRRDERKGGDQPIRTTALRAPS